VTYSLMAPAPTEPHHYFSRLRRAEFGQHRRNSGK